MAGHSHSANIKYRKDRVNAAKAKVFSKIARMVTVAAKLGGGDPDANPRLRLAIEKARMVSMPKENIARAIKKGTGDGDVGDYEELMYEGYAAGGVAVMAEVLTDNRNRTAPEIRKAFEKNGGNLGTAGAVAWMFERKATFPVASDCALSEDQLMEIAIEAGAEDLLDEGDHFEIRCDPSEFVDIREALERAEVPLDGGEVGYVPKTTAVVADIAEARKVARLLDALEEHDDVQNVFANFEFTDEVLADLAADA
jgi:YebC/PmpR family DNA-binding regulatory protein